MSLSVQKVQVWSGELSDRPGAAAGVLEVLARSGADLQFVFTRSQPDDPNAFEILLAPILGPQQTEAAKLVGLSPASNTAMLRVEGHNQPGIGYELMSRLAVANLPLRGMSVSAVGDRFAAHLAFENADAAALAVQVLATLD
jgi:hypothetical protein